MPLHRQQPLRIESLEGREVPSNTVLHAEQFEATPVGSTPAGWAQWSSNAFGSYSVSDVRASSGTQSLASTGNSNTTTRFWYDAEQPADTSVSASLFLDSLVPVRLFVRGQNLNTATPTFYSLTAIRGATVQLSQVVNGQSTVLATLTTPSWFSQRWIRATLHVEGTELRAEIQRADTGQFLNSSGTWQTEATNALRVNNAAITGSGRVGVQRDSRFAGAVYVDDLTVFGQGDYLESFDAIAPGTLPSGWQQTNPVGAPFAVTTLRGNASAQSFGSSVTTSAQSGIAWRDEIAPADVTVSTSVFTDSLVPAHLFLRGTQLQSNAPSYYGVQVQRGSTLSIIKMVNGVSTTIGSIATRNWFSSRWLAITFSANDDRLRISAQRPDTGQYLNQNGDWQDAPTFALEVRDTTLTTPGYVGISRLRGLVGTVTFDDLKITSSDADTIAPTVAIIMPTGSAPLTGVVTARADADDANGISRVEFWLNGVKRGVASGDRPFEWTFDSRNEPNGTYLLTVRAFDPEGNVGTASRTITINNDAVITPRPNIPRNYSHIRIAQLAYYGNPMGAFEKTLLENSVDLVVPNIRYLNTIDAASSDTPQLIYSNVSNLYLDLLADWINWADAHDVSRELAFYHVNAATAWTGSSPSSQPVTWFSNAERGPTNPTNWSTGFTDLTSQVRSATEGISLGGVGTSTYIGHLERFREINFTLARPPAGAWNAVLEYVSATDAAGNPTAWKTMSLLSNTTNTWLRSGTLTFDPPADWQQSSIGGSRLLYHVRLRVTSGTSGDAPQMWRILGRDYVQANGSNQGVIPAFDQTADRDGDGYLNDAEFANRRAGFEARFYYESRLFYPSYGQMRFVTNPSSVPVQTFLGEYHKAFLDSQPLADGLFVDNSGGKLPFSGISVQEPTANYAADYGAALAAINRMIAPRWVMANTVGGGTAAEAVVRQVPASIEEFLIRPLATHWSGFNDVAELVRRRQSLNNPAPYLVLDSMPTGGSTSDPRTQIATLAYYYLIGNPETTFLMFYGGYEPHSTWTKHWSQAAAYDVGQPLAEWREFATGADPANTRLTYKVLSREYSNSLVLYKPLSYNLGVGTGTTANNTATTHALNGRYRILQSDGTLSATTVTSVTLRNGEGAILIKA